MDKTTNKKPIDHRARWLFLGLIAVTLLTLVSGVIQGELANRWGTSTAMSDAAKKLEQLPHQFGDWKACDEQRLDKSTEKMLECVGHVSRKYVNQKTNAEISMIVLLGPSGPISVHTPEICFSSRDYKTDQARQAVRINEQNQLWNVTFRSRKLESERLSVYYGWSTGDKWVAADDPRYGFAGSPYLYKIQLAGTVSPGSVGKSTDVCRTFLNDFLPELKEYLIDPSGN